MKQGTAKIQCGCQHEFQDKKYGANTRVANTTQKGDQQNTDVRCTVCSRVQRVADDRIKR